jgi:CubicO group peptidase (beta-lactamase class C family)
MTGRPTRAALRGLVATLALLTVAVAGAAAQQPRTLAYGAPEDVGMSSAVLSGAVGLYEEAVARGDLVGAVLLVVRQGRVVLHEAVGSRDEERGLPMERNTLFRMASNTKPVVATAVAQLVEQRKLRYDDLVREHIPEWDNYRSGFITVGQLLSHSSGLRISSLFLEPLMRPSAEHPDAPTLRLEAARYGAVGGEVEPGRTYSYNNPGFNTLAALVEIASGKLLEDYLEGAVYGPLGMVDSYNHRIGHTAEGKLDRMGAVYYRRDTDGSWAPGGTPGVPVAFPFARGSGGMISTAWDYAIFCQTFLNGGSYAGVRVLSPESVALMTSPKIAIGGEGESASSYGYGWSLTDGTYGHSGSDGTMAWIDPEREIIGLVFTQTPAGPNPVERFRRIVNLSLNER